MEEILGSIRRILAEDERGGPPLPPRARAASDVLDLTEAIGDDGTVRHIEPKAMRLDTAPPPSPLPDGRVEPVPPRPAAAGSGDRLVSAPAAAAVAGSFARLADVPREAPAAAEPDTERALDDIVRESLRPLLQAWLDEHLPGLVERLVQEEIARMTGDAGNR
jgi:cell pole-organizing protein PopZ